MAGPRSAGKIVYRFLDTVGDGTGTKNANGDYSTPDRFLISPSGDVGYFLNRMIVDIEDTAGIQQNEYGNLGVALTNGINIRIRDASDAVQLDLLDGVPIKTNDGWGRQCYDVVLQSWDTTPVNESVHVRWTFAAAGQPLYIPAGWSFNVELADNLTGLIAHYFQVQGWQED